MTVMRDGAYPGSSHYLPPEFIRMVAAVRDAATATVASIGSSLKTTFGNGHETIMGAYDDKVDSNSLGVLIFGE